MGIGDPADPVDSDVEVNNPVPKSTLDAQKAIGDRLTVTERALITELTRQMRIIYADAGLPYPPP